MRASEMSGITSWKKRELRWSRNKPFPLKAEVWTLPVGSPFCDPCPADAHTPESDLPRCKELSSGLFHKPQGLVPVPGYADEIHTRGQAAQIPSVCGASHGLRLGELPTLGVVKAGAQPGT